MIRFYILGIQINMIIKSVKFFNTWFMVLFKEVNKYIEPNMLYTVQCIMYTVQCTLYILYNVQYALYIVQYTVYIVQCIMHNVIYMYYIIYNV